MPRKYKLDRQEQEELYHKLFPGKDYEHWQDFQKLIYNIIRRWKGVDK